jgi:hypothetical protein
VFLPRHHPLTPLIVSQLLKFPGDTYDDQVDAMTQLVNHVQGTGPIRVSTVHYGRGTGAPPPPDPFADPKPVRRPPAASRAGFR